MTPVTPQHPKTTVAWALRGVEIALQHVGDGPAENRVRRQFHQLVLAIERYERLTDDGPADGGDNPQKVA